jgi:hypothetical protein
MLIFHLTRDWRAGQIQTSWTASTRAVVPEVETLIDRTWSDAVAQPGIHLFDGPMCRLESWNAPSDKLHLVLSRTSYKAFFGTNMRNPQLADAHGRAVLANPVGVSPALLSSDNHLMLGRRNALVAYYPHKLHPFAGAIEPRARLARAGKSNRKSIKRNTAEAGRFPQRTSRSSAHSTNRTSSPPSRSHRSSSGEESKLVSTGL